MSKTITIDRCWHCKFRDEETDFCSKLAKYIFDISEIMPDCPLPDSEAAQQAMLDEVIDLFWRLAREEDNAIGDEFEKELKQKYGKE